MMIYSVFITIKLDTVWFHVSTAICVGGPCVYAAAPMGFVAG
jgi:hypothetical protein